MDPSANPHGTLHRRRDILWLVGLLVLATGYYWIIQWRHFGYWSDTTLYIAGARSLAEGHGYNFGAHYGTPRIGLYPPVQSAWMALWWKFNPNFPDNIPWLNASMIVLAVGSLGCGFYYLRKQSVPPVAAAAAMLTWGFSAKWSNFIFWLSSDIGFCGLGIAIACLWLRPLKNREIPWWLTGFFLALAYCWRTAAVGLIAGTGLVALWQVRQRRFVPLLAIGLPTGIAFFTWRALSAGSPGYLAIWPEFIRDLGGWSGYVLQVLKNIGSCVRGQPFWDMICGAIARLPERIGGKNAAAGLLAGLITMAAFWLFARLVWKGWRTGTTDLDRALAVIAGVYTLQVVVVPFGPEHFHRYFYLFLTPAFAWAWRGWQQTQLPASWQSRVTIGAIASFMGLFLANAQKIRKDRLYMEELLPLSELKEAADWTRNNTPTEAHVAIDFRLPIEHFHAWLGRPLVVDYFHPTYRTSPVAYAAQGGIKADYVLVCTKGPEIYTPPARFPIVFRSHSDRFRVVQVVPQ
ncbi:MAG: hypothetical protein EXS36_14240 [Pedosphaera sp.]|nr:hypothetical protein [Pedosphaera sp.]